MDYDPSIVPFLIIIFWIAIIIGLTYLCKKHDNSITYYKANPAQNQQAKSYFMREYAGNKLTAMQVADSYQRPIWKRREPGPIHIEVIQCKMKKE